MRGPSDSTALRLLLGHHLRRHRQHSGRSRSQADHLLHTRGAASTATGLELGTGRVILRDVMALCEWYGVDDHDERARLLDLAQKANTPRWWEAFTDIIPPSDLPYLGLEQEAAQSLQALRPHTIPSLLHTPDYARAALTARESADADYRLALLLHRQQRLLNGDLTMTAVLTETTLTHAPGDRRVLFRQLERLEDLCDHPNLTIHITTTPSAFEPVSLFHRPITLNQLPLPTTLVHLAEPTRYLDQPDDVARYRRLLTELTTRTPAHETPRLLHAIRRGL